MLFDLRSPKRRRFIQIVFGALAAVFAVSFVFFGVGSEVQGGFGDLFNQGGGGGQEDAIEDAEEKLETNPNDTAALAELVQLHFQAGNAEIEIDEETQQTVFTSDAEEEYGKSADAWDRYVELTKAQADPSVALLAVQNFAALAQGKLTAAAGGGGQAALDDADDSLASWKGAAEAQRVVAQQAADPGAFQRLAEFLFFAGEFAQADKAAKRALAAAEGNQAPQVKQELDSAEQQGREVVTAIDDFRKQLAAAGAEAPDGGENPLGEFGGGGLGGGGGLSTP